MTLQEILKEQRFNFLCYMEIFGGGDLNEIEIKAMDKLLKEENAKIIKAVCEEMTGEERKHIKEDEESDFEFIHGYNARVQKEQEKANQLIKETKI